MEKENVFYRAIGHSRFPQGETPLCTYCFRPAMWAFMYPPGQTGQSVLLCDMALCHSEFVHEQAIEIELSTTCTSCGTTIAVAQAERTKTWLATVPGHTSTPEEGPHCFTCGQMIAAKDYDYLPVDVQREDRR